jgi:hypothetical protein
VNLKMVPTQFVNHEMEMLLSYIFKIFGFSETNYSVQGLLRCRKFYPIFFEKLYYKALPSHAP